MKNNHRSAAQRNRRLRERLDDVTDTLEKTVEATEQNSRDIKVLRSQVRDLQQEKSRDR